MSRTEFPKSVKRDAWDRCGGRCENCTAKLTPGKFAYDHIVADGLGGEPVLSNASVLCDACHGVKTATHDVPLIAKAKRIHDRFIGAETRTKRPFPGSRASGWKKPFNSPAIRREQ